jgi:hypothetical protein
MTHQPRHTARAGVQPILITILAAIALLGLAFTTSDIGRAAPGVRQPLPAPVAGLDE